MAQAGWTPALAVGHPEMDAQREELFRRAERLLDAMIARDAAEVGPRFELLGACAAELFAAEERLMAESGFPGANVHRAAHQRFLRDCQALRQLHVASGASAAVAVKARLWLPEWLQTHVGGIDQQLGLHLRQRAGAVRRAG